MTTRTRLTLLTATAAAAAMVMTGCVAGEGQTAPELVEGAEWSATELTLDFATYNPLSLIIKEQGWLEAELGDEVTVNWVQSAGSNKANEALRAGAIDVGSTAGSAALLARSNGSPIQVIDIYTQPNWASILVPAGSDIDSVDDLAGRTVAATKGTDPYFFLLQALAEEGLALEDIQLQNLQHADGKTALETGAVEAWSGLDPLLSTSVYNGSAEIIYDNVDFNSYGFLNATESFIAESPDLAQLVVNAYEKARAWALENPEETAAILAEVAGIEVPIAEATIERTVIDIDPVPGQTQRDVLEIIGPIFVESGDVPNQEQIDTALDSLFNDTFAAAADPDALAGE
ncbi:aliphatic sulfonate ABC transporter substrate-binding protein [Microcella daejeonensis]|uniref:aliphatic sulfonate ABC transporter substrate-binding protein n=1 Tax=Microcella daejeonensis TaxID=2994971 RepID=UPI00227169D7|nr:aliphatic sulfonate ABC transporter substrate-binding protein [Microcella daejeonensis]WAB83359.1 aliphatic sulfonate ABC transporter substrate-binding protein [Microcella daejeonensis]